MYSNGANIDTDFAGKVFEFSCNILNINQLSLYTIPNAGLKIIRNIVSCAVMADGCRSGKFNLLNS